MAPKQLGVRSTLACENYAQQVKTAHTEEGAHAFRNATRIQESVTSALEHRTLLWLAARMPCWVTSDHLTLLGLLSMLMAGASYLLARWHPVGLIAATAMGVMVVVAAAWHTRELYRQETLP